MPGIEIPLNEPHPAQWEILQGRKRFNVLKCGRRFGKTELFQELLSECIERFQIIGYWTPTYKDLHEVWLETLRVFHPIVRSKSESIKQIDFYGGGKLDMWSMEDPDSGRGRKYHRAVVDECEKAKKFRQAWEESIRPTLTDYQGDAYLISTPKFGPTYFKEITRNQDIHDDWKSFVYTTYDNPYMDPKEIEAARRLLPAEVFNCEYLAQDVESRGGKAFAYALNKTLHFDKTIFHDYAKPTVLSVDFNLIPYTCLASNLYTDSLGFHLNCTQEIIIQSGSVPEMGDRIRNLFASQLHSLIITGDALGRNRNISQRDNASNFELLRRTIGLRQNQIQVPANPTHEVSRNDCNYLLHVSTNPLNRISVKVNPVACPILASELQTTLIDDEGSIIKADRTQVSQRADQLDNFRYTVNTFCKREIERHQKANFGRLKLA